ncbi:alginate lyase family protein [Lutibacter sp.]|uniref:alginate lyase family protein n=1 Tax=Lutibacter sp. TaxID=1925666 RepID=UPI0034A03EC6
MIKGKKILFVILLVCVFNTKATTNPFIRIDSSSLSKSKVLIENGTASEQTLAAYKKLIQNADKLLTIKNPTVIDKTVLPPTRNKHDYLSLSRYWWPNPETADGLPWVRQDGNTNPETQTDAVDRKRLGFMGTGVWKLSLAYYFTNNEKYAQKAVSMIETWFLNPETLMNPHLEFAQSVPGNSNKRATGILDGRSIVMYVPDAINLLSKSNYWSENHQTKITAWFTDYLNWLTKSKLGIKGSKQKNNHVSWYRFQVAALALYLDDKPLVKEMVELAQNSLEEMLNNEGGQTHELARTKSFSYSCFNLQALTNIAEIGNRIGMHMWYYKSENKKSLTLAINYLTPVIEGEKWRHNTLKAIDVSDLVPILSQSAANYKTNEFKNLLSKVVKIIDKNNQNDKIQEFWLLNSIHL